MNQRQSPRGSPSRKLSPFKGSNGQAAKLDFDIDVELDIDWEGLGFGSPGPSPVEAPASETRPALWRETAPVSRIGMTTLNLGSLADPNPAHPARSEEEEAPTRVYVARTPNGSEPPAPPPPAPPEREAAPTLVSDPVRESPARPRNTTLIIPRSEVVGSAETRGSGTSGQTLIMRQEQLLGRPQAADEAGTATKVMPIAEVIGGHGPRQAELLPSVPLPDATDDDLGPHTKMMPIDVLMKRAKAQQRWPLPGVAQEVQLRDSESRGANKRSLFGRIGDGWRNTSLVRKLSLLLMPLLCAVIVVRYSKLVLSPKAPRAKKAVAAASAARSKPPAKPSPKPAPAPVSELPAPPKAEAAMPVAAASGVPVAAAAATPESSAKSAPVSSAGAEPAPPARGSGSSGVTAQRKAADAVAEGDYGAAVERYRSLAKDEPGVSAYREAARILEERANGARP